jgi:WD40 repeat protein
MRFELAHGAIAVALFALLGACGSGVSRRPVRSAEVADAAVATDVRDQDSAGPSASDAADLGTPGSDGPAARVVPWPPDDRWRTCGSLGEGGVTALALSADSKLGAVGYGSGLVTLQDLVTRVTRRSWRTSGGDGPSALSFSHDGALLAVGHGRQVQVWVVSSGALLSTMSVQPAANWMTFTADRSALLVQADGTLTLFRVEDGARVRGYTGYGYIQGAALSTARQQVLLVDSESRVRVLDMSGRELPRPTLVGSQIQLAPDGSAAIGVAPSPNGNEDVVLWSLPDGKVLWRLPGRTFVGRIVFVPGGDRMLFNSPPVELRRRSDGGLIAAVQGDWSQDGPLAASPTNLLLVRDGLGVTHASSVDGSPLSGFASLPGHRAEIRGLALSPDGQRLVVIGEDAPTGPLLWDLTRGVFEREAPSSEHLLYARFSPDGRHLAVSGDGAKVVGLADDATVWALTLAPVAIDPNDWTLSTVVDFTGDGRRVAVGGVDGLAVYDVQTNALVARLAPEPLLGVAFSPDGQTLADSRGRLWRTSDLSPRPTSAPDVGARKPGYAESWVAFAPSGEFFVTARSVRSYEGPWVTEGEVLRASDGALVRKLPVGIGRRPVFSPDAQWILAGDTVFNITTGDTRPLGVPATVSLVAPDGRILAGGPDGIVRFLCAP